MVRTEVIKFQVYFEGKSVGISKWMDKRTEEMGHPRWC